ncbi:MAG: helix-turn-helix domain-containing protein [Ruthenibacterium lactatiformans]
MRKPDAGHHDRPAFSGCGDEPLLFFHVLQKQMSESPVQYITRKRIRLAIELLKDENLSILEVALRSGFNNAANFNRAFRQLTETSPSEYRKKQKKDRR